MNIIELSTMTEEELRDTDIPFPKTEEELLELINALISRQHDYGTCVYAMSLVALSAFRYASSKLGVSGFQASCADMDFLKRSRGYKYGFQIIDYNNIFYPQYLTEEHFPSHEKILNENKEQFSKIAKEILGKFTGSESNNVKHRLEYIASLDS